MANKRKEIVFTYPEAVDNWSGARLQDTLAIMRQFEEYRLKVEELLSLGKMEVPIRMHSTRPICIIPFSDTHLYTVDSEYNLWKKLQQRLILEPDTYGAIVGDFLQGYDPSKPDLIRKTIYDMTGQILNGKEEIRELVRMGKILFAVDGYGHHEEFTLKLAGLNALVMLFEGLTQPDGTPLQVVSNTGSVIFEFPGGIKDVWQVAHNPGGGSTKLNPTGAQKRMSSHFRLDDESCPSTTIGGNWHHAAGVSTELKHRKDTDEIVERRYFALGTNQGVTSGRPQQFLTSRGLDLSKKPGVADILIQHDGKLLHWSVFGYDKADIVLRAAKLWDAAASGQGMVNELVEKVVDRNKKPVARFRPEKSRMDKKTNSREGGVANSPLWQSMTWEIDGGFRIPMAVYIVANARYPSSSTDEVGIKKVVGEIASNPLAFGIVGRHMIDKDVSKSHDRLEALNRMIRVLAPAKKKWLAFMLSESLREEPWKDDLGSERKPVPNGQGIITGDYIHEQSELKGVPLYPNEGMINLQVGPYMHKLLGLDHLNWSGSADNPYLGLIKAKERVNLSFDVVFGGHNPGVGVLSTEDTEYIAPGWFSLYAEKGKSNISESPPGGQGMILSPNRKMVIGLASFESLRDMHQALILEEGLTEREKASLMKVRSRSR